jgi:hypothetical protein
MCVVASDGEGREVTHDRKAIQDHSTRILSSQATAKLAGVVSRD